MSVSQNLNLVIKITMRDSIFLTGSVSAEGLPNSKLPGEEKLACPSKREVSKATDLP